MKHPIKKNEIYQKLKKAIDDGIHPGGSFLPNETALAQIMGIVWQNRLFHEDD